MLNIRILLISSEVWARLYSPKQLTTIHEDNRCKCKTYCTIQQHKRIVIMSAKNSVKLTNLSDSDTQSELKVFQLMVLIKYHIDIFTVNANNCPSYEGNNARFNTCQNRQMSEEVQVRTEETNTRVQHQKGSLEYKNRHRLFKPFY